MFPQANSSIRPLSCNFNTLTRQFIFQSFYNRFPSKDKIFRCGGGVCPILFHHLIYKTTIAENCPQCFAICIWHKSKWIMLMSPQANSSIRPLSCNFNTVTRQFIFQLFYNRFHREDNIFGRGGGGLYALSYSIILDIQNNHCGKLLLNVLLVIFDIRINELC